MLLVSAVHLARTTQSREDQLGAFQEVKDYLTASEMVDEQRLGELVRENNWATSLVGLLRPHDDKLKFNCSGCDKLLDR